MNTFHPPNVTPLQWSTIRSVFPNEAWHFTPWLSQNLQLLGDAIGVQDLELVAIEAPIGEMRLDIRANAFDDAGQQYAVAIESQYGSSDHDHLGKLVTYAAHAYDDPDVDHIINIWIVETVREPHRAAIDFLNRTSPDEVSYLIVTPRFVPAPSGFYVHFDVLARPNEFLRRAQAGTEAQVNPERVAYMTALHDHIKAELGAQGYRGSWCDPRGSMIRVYFPDGHPLASWAELRILATRQDLRLVLYVINTAASAEECDSILSTIRALHEDELQATAAAPIDWDSPGGSAIRANAWARAEHEGLGYDSPDLGQVARVVLTFSQAVIQSTAGDDPGDYPLPVGEGSVSADTATVVQILKLIEKGEWTTYGDVSIAATGRASSAMAVGTILASVEKVPNPHRVLNKGGKVPAGWLASDGKGPEECVRRLEVDGVSVIGGKADPARYVAGPTLAERLKQARSQQDGALPESGV